MSTIKTRARMRTLESFDDSDQRWAIRNMWTAIEVLEADNKLLRDQIAELFRRVESLDQSRAHALAGYPGYD